MVVIGAGFAGLGAAVKLMSNSLFKVTVLEGTSKVGGRAHTITVSDQVVEMGCQFFYLYENPPGSALPQYAMSKKLHIAPQIGGKSPYDQSQVQSYQPQRKLELLSNGDVMPHDKVQLYKHIFDTIQREAEIRAEEEDWSYVIDPRANWTEKHPLVPDKIGYREYVTRRFMSVTASDAHHLDQSAAWTPEQVLEHLLTFEGFSSGSKKAEDVDVPSYDDYYDEDGYIPLVHGFQSVAEELAKELPAECIQYDKEVQTIQWTPAGSSTAEDNGSPVTVACADGTTYTADHVIVTVSLGVLKEKCLSPTSSPRQFFHPILPDSKLECIRDLGMGVINKVILQFKEPLVSDTVLKLSLFWRKEDRSFPEKYPWASGIQALDRVRDSNVYIVWFAGEDAVAIENLSAAEVAEGICLVLEKFLRRPIDRPIRVEKSDWGKNRFFRGSYSYNAIGSDEEDREELSEPLDSLTPLQVLFAGEATHDGLYGTTNAAYETGLREASRLIELYEQL